MTFSNSVPWISEFNSCRSVRGNKTAIELFIAGARGWEAGIRRRMEGSESE